MRVPLFYHNEEYTLTSVPSHPTPHPATEDRKAWREYWEAQGQAWRIELEIEAMRRKFLADRLTIVPNMRSTLEW